MPTWHFHDGEGYSQEAYAEHPLYFGFELEMAARHTVEAERLMAENTDILTAGHDASINSNNWQLEIRFHPGTWLWWLQNRNRLNKLIRALRHEGAQSNSHPLNCGMHVHISRVFSTNMQVNLLHMVYSHVTEMTQFSKRLPGELQMWCRLDPVQYGRPTRTCDCSTCTRTYELRLANWEAQQRYGINTVDGIRRLYAQGLYTQKYNAVHVLPHTLEVRLFSGTDNCRQLWANMELCRALVEYVGQDGYNPDVHSAWGLFHNWIRARQGFNCLKWAMNRITSPVTQQQEPTIGPPTLVPPDNSVTTTATGG